MIDTNTIPASANSISLQNEIDTLRIEIATARENSYNVENKFRNLRGAIRGFFSVYVDNNPDDDEFEISLEDINAFLSVHGISEIEREYEWDVVADVRASITVRVIAGSEDAARDMVDGMDLEISSWEYSNIEVDHMQIDVSDVDRVPS